ncbi:MAG: hypothetical protein ACXWQQ_16435 [Pseudobdellovibrio sp.]
MNFFVPGKTFLVGEYSVLLGGAALGLATRPYFEYQLTEAEEVTEFHPESPAGLYLKAHNEKSGSLFKDAYSIGGFGRSTAEYFAAITPDLLKNKKSFFDILKEYKELHSHKAVKPSGIDLAFQFFGNVTMADPQLNFYQTLDWNLVNTDFYLISSGLKINTHEHLAKLDLNSLKDLVPVSEQVIKSYTASDDKQFLEDMKHWCDLLDEKHLTHLNSVHIRKHLEKNPDIKLVKPCGALGADVLIVFFASERAEYIKNYLVETKFKIQAHSHDLANGLSTQLREYWSQNVD